MKKTDYTELVERYCYCPYCQSLQSDKINQNDFEDGDILTCDDCGKKFKIEN